MKRHVSLILALLMVLSAFFTLPVEAARTESSTKEEQHVHELDGSVCACENERCEAEPREVGAATASVGASGEEINAKACAHRFQTKQYNASKHKKVCKLCGYTYYVSHSYNYSIQSGSSHKKYCSCGYSVYSAHTFGYTSTGNTHTKYCTLCGYGAGSESHSLKYTILDGGKHKTYCTLCTFSTTNSHSCAYVFTGNTHTKYCKLCGYGFGSESHDYPSKWSCDNASTHSKTCSICGYALTQPHTLEKRTYWDVDLYYEEWCTSSGCSYRYKTLLVNVINP